MMKIANILGITIEELALLDGIKLHEYLGARESNPAHAAAMLELVKANRSINRGGIHDHESAAGWLGISLQDWECTNSWQVRYGYTAQYTTYRAGDYELTIRHYIHDGYGCPAGEAETDVFLERREE